MPRSYQDVAITWSVAAGNITWSVQCNPQNITTPPPISWCAIGINTLGTGTGMGPAEAFWLGVDPSGNARAVEDRIIVAAAQPACASTQLTWTSASSYVNNVLSATFTRPLTVSPALGALGYVSIPNYPISVIAAIGTGPNGTACSMTAAEHYGAFHNIFLNWGSN